MGIGMVIDICCEENFLFSLHCILYSIFLVCIVSTFDLVFVTSYMSYL